MELPEIFTGTPTPSKWAALGEYLRGGGIRSGPGLRVRQVGNKTILSTRRRGSGGVSQLLPFEVTASPARLIAAPGVIGETSISGAVLEQASPTDGTWHLVAKVVINATTGEVTSEAVYWNSSSPTDTTTDFHVSIASVEITAGEVTDSIQFNYGPIYVNVGGGATDIWSVVIL